MSKKLDLLGQRFGRLVVIDSAPNKKCKGGQTKTVWKCKCDCGNFCYVTTQELRKGDTVSCGCYASEQKKFVLLHMDKDILGLTKFGAI